MNFYNLDYITQHQSFNLVLRSVILIVLLAIVMLTSLHYMRNRLKTRLRDISIGIVVLMFILLGFKLKITCKITMIFRSHKFLSNSSKV